MTKNELLQILENVSPEFMVFGVTQKGNGFGIPITSVRLDVEENYISLECDDDKYIRGQGEYYKAKDLLQSLANFPDLNVVFGTPIDYTTMPVCETRVFKNEQVNEFHLLLDKDDPKNKDRLDRPMFYKRKLNRKQKMKFKLYNLYWMHNEGFVSMKPPPKEIN